MDFPWELEWVDYKCSEEDSKRKDILHYQLKHDQGASFAQQKYAHSIDHTPHSPLI